MKRNLFGWGGVVLVLAALVLLVHPVKVLSGDSYHYAIYITGTNTDVEMFSPTSGGWRAYLDEDNYIWFSGGSADVQSDGHPFGIHWNFFWQKPELRMGREW